MPALETRWRISGEVLTGMCVLTDWSKPKCAIRLDTRNERTHQEASKRREDKIKDVGRRPILNLDLPSPR